MMLILAFAVCVAVSEAATCPDLSVVQDFDVEKFAGTWYNQAGLTGNYLTQGPGSCAQADYTLDSDTGVLSVVNTQKSIIGTKQTVKGTAVLADSTKTEAKLKVTLKTLLGNQTALLSCLASDYDNFAILYSCSEAFGVVLKSGWILTRTRLLEDEEKEGVESLIAGALATAESEGGPAYKDFHTISQKNC